MPINFQVRSHKPMQKMHRLVFTQICQKLAGSRSWKNTKNSQVCGCGKMPKNRHYAVKQKCQQLTGPRSRKNAKNPQVRSHRNMPINSRVFSHKEIKRMHVHIFAKIPKTHRSVFMETFQKLADPQSQIYANKLPGLQSCRSDKNA